MNGFPSRLPEIPETYMVEPNAFQVFFWCSLLSVLTLAELLVPENFQVVQMADLGLV